MPVYEESELQPIQSLVADLGQRIEAFRLSRNLRQQDVADEAGVHVSSIRRLEQGEGGSLDTLVRVLRALGCADRLADLVPDASMSPLDPMAGQNRQRQRARPSGSSADEPWSWGDDA